MKRIYSVIVLFAFMVSVYPQYNIYNTLRGLYETHDSNISTGRRSLEITENKAVLASYAIGMMLISSAQGYSVDSVAYWKNVIDNILGVTTSSFDLTYDAVLVVSEEFDTILIDSMYFKPQGQWVKYVHTTDSIIKLALKYGVDSVKTHSFDSLSATKFKLNGVNVTYVHTTDSISSLIETAVRDSLHTGVLSITGTIGGSGQPTRDIHIQHAEHDSERTLRFVNNYGVYDTLYIALQSSGNGVRFQLPNMAAYINIDNNGIYFGLGTTGTQVFYWDGTNIIMNTDSVARYDSIRSHNTRILKHNPSGLNYTLQLSDGTGGFTSDADFTIQGDSARLKNLVVPGGIRWHKYAGADTFGIYGLPNGLFDTLDYTRTAGWMLSNSDKLEPFEMFFFNRDKKGELNWPRCWGDSYYRISPKEQHVQFMAAHERTWIYMYDLYKNKRRQDRIIKEQDRKIIELQDRILTMEYLIDCMVKDIKVLKNNE